jgi:DNA mismatch repair protein MutL
MPIQILPDEVASQIAAGEVIERPASVVKELLENALDAGSNQVTLRIEGAGKRLIEVADDGAGIPSAELALALARHATSKLRSADDLFHITTLGFRGEALASIASVSRLTLVSRHHAAQTGARLEVEGGKAGSPVPAGVPQGTVVRVEDLFFNVPARLKFLKQDSTERQQIDNLVTRYALAYPTVRFQLFEDGRPVLQTTGSGSRREVLANLYGVDVSRQMLEVDLLEEPQALKGFTSPVALTRSNRKEMTFFVNGRWIQDTSLHTALIQAYHTLLMVGRFPMAILFIELPPEEVDVNVHPAKAEVRFRRSDQIFSLVQRGVRRALLAHSPVPPVSAPYWRPAESSQIDISWSLAGQTKDPRSNLDPSAALTTPLAPSPGKDPLPGGQIPLLRLVGQVGAAYIVAEGPDGLYLIDQHAAHERVLFEKLLQQMKTRIPAQALLEPVLMHLPPASAALLTGQLTVLTDLGFQIEPFGPGAFRIRAIPVLFLKSDPVSAVRVVVEDFEEDETPLKAEVESRLAARICKRAAVKAGQVISTEEQRALLQDLEACQSPRTCPHGRPTMIHLSVDLLERQFGRRGSR